jgi:hypothetical protein
MATPQEDSVAIVQSGINPITGSPLSSEQRKALLKRTVAPSSILGRGGSPIGRTDDSSSLVVAQTQQITSLQDQLNVLRVEVSTLNNGLTNIGNIIQRDGILEQQRLRGEQEAERRNAEQQVRIGKESELERGIQSALMVPVVALQKKVTNIFANIFGALTTLFTGWLTNQGIETLKALDEGNKVKLEQIKDTVLKNIAYAIGAIATIKIGFGAIISSVVGLTARIGRVATNLALAPFRALGSTLNKVPGALGGLFGGAGNKISNFFGGAGAATRGATAAAAKGARSIVPKLFAPLNIGISAYRFSQGDPVGGALSAAAAIPGVGLPAVGLDIAREMGFGKGTWFGKNEGSEQQSQSQEPPITKVDPQESMMPQSSDLTISSQKQETPTTSQPQTSMVSPPSPEMIKNLEMAWQYRNNPMARGRIEGAWEKMTPEQKQQSKDWAKMKGYDWNEMKLKESPVTIQSTLKESPATIQSPLNPIPQVGTLPEPQPNVVMLPAPQSQTRQSMIGPSSSGSDAPLINSANPDNFYVLYSQLNYNVVM